MPLRRLTASSGPSCVPTPPNRPTNPTDHAFFGSLVLQLYAASGFGSYLIAQNLDVPGFNGSVNPSARNTAIEALNLYWISLGLNLAWSPLFFGLQQPLVALVDIVALTGVVGALTVKAHQLPTIKNLPTSLFFAPYLGASSYSAPSFPQTSTAADPVCRFLLNFTGWLGYATYLNASYYFKNYSLSGTRRTPKSL